ncbi:MAG TPA: outer spore coat protein CotE [Candidatus Onthousia excrementipullorum]|uniref:Outer spore coat protein CotE n=1 Tax=Candidatus Onthousia excrementipullorum TaxID=2840884 RepID=A0A9D1J2X3_9FIRM|nr:outer spore coat protein CotE [Candidatus Onthousia excrementipullorum]
MASFKEIVTKAVIGKGKKQFTDNLSLQVTNSPNTILGCWVINHNFSGTFSNGVVTINGSYDINIWYSYDNDTKTEVLKDTKNYTETINVQGTTDTENEEVIIRSLSGPSCSKAEINGSVINCTIDKTLGIELVGDTKVRINTLDEVDDWEEIMDSDSEIDERIDKEVNEEYLDNPTE